MKLLIATYGTEGDVRPLAVLARRWMAAGHEVLLLADRATLGGPMHSGVPCMALEGDIRGELGSETSIAGVVGTHRGARSTARALASIASRQAESWLHAVIEAGRDADAIVGSGLAVFSALSAGEHLRLPVVGASFIPITPTSAFASPFLRPSRWPGFVNRASHRIVNDLVWRSVRDACNSARRRVAGLAPRREPWTEHPVLYGISPTLLPRPTDWPAQVELCGQWADRTVDWHPPPALAAFLADGPPPVYVGFGSMTGFDRAAVWRTTLDALRGRRALLAPGWAGLSGVTIPRDAFVVDESPHEALFAHVCAVVHHGGSGTSHSAARAGLPSVVVAFAGDQEFWGSLLAAAGIAAPPLSAQRLDPGKLAQAIDHAQRDDVRARARSIGAAMQCEDGTTRAVEMLEEHIALQPRAFA